MRDLLSLKTFFPPSETFPFIHSCEWTLTKENFFLRLLCFIFRVVVYEGFHCILTFKDRTQRAVIFFFSGFPVHFYRNLWCVICLCCTGLCMILTVQTLLAASHVCKLLKLKFCLRQSDSAVPTILCPRHSSSFKTKAMLGKSVFHSLSHFDSIRFRCNIERDSAL